MMPSRSPASSATVTSSSARIEGLPRWSTRTPPRWLPSLPPAAVASMVMPRPRGKYRLTPLARRYMSDPEHDVAAGGGIHRQPERQADEVHHQHPGPAVQRDGPVEQRLADDLQV